MKRLLSLVLVLFTMQCAGCGGDTHESIMKEQIDTMKTMVSTLEGIKDESSAKSAKPTLESLAKQMKEIEARGAKLPAPTAEEAKALQEKYSKDMEDLMPRMMKEMFRVGMDEKMGPILKDIDMDVKGARN